ncbi:uncharacterized protein LOC129804793 [Phlebotomus papatasi]|uniref:uncharacterized protein LOC129804793 n=1 Tax=Phlebotomus papatasi TaxID=29031 RepID=UPI0024835A0B|nr:uncharacterized protein LOC129804793 [Phlebotomus papatasi]
MQWLLTLKVTLLLLFSEAIQRFGCNPKPDPGLERLLCEPGHGALAPTMYPGIPTPGFHRPSYYSAYHHGFHSPYNSLRPPPGVNIPPYYSARPPHGVGLPNSPRPYGFFPHYYSARPPHGVGPPHPAHPPHGVGPPHSPHPPPVVGPPHSVRPPGFLRHYYMAGPPPGVNIPP